MPDEPTTGATPGAGATPAQAGQPTSSTPAAQGATPPAGTTAPAAATPPAMGEDAALGDAGRRILAEARRQAREAEDRARAAEAERDTLKAATLSESERAIAEATKAGEKAATERFEARIRASEIRAALTAASISASELDLALHAPEFARLKVTDDGLDGLASAVQAFKAGHPALFAPPPRTGVTGSADGGVRPPAGYTAQIAAAEAAGDFRTVLRLQNRQLREAAAKR
jgi:hypothetical protein